MSELHHWKAPAKVNLTLKVLGKRSDGFHEMESLMAPISLFDELFFEPAHSYQLVCDAPGVPVDESNLVTKSVRLFQRHTEKKCHWKITLKKNIPHGAGLAGGSSDAATVMLALNELEKTNLTKNKMAELLAEIGSDISFFIYQTSCMTRGRGEKVEPLQIPNLRGTKILLLKPHFGVSTPDAYKRWVNAKPLHGIDYSPQKLPWGEIVNDLELPVFEKYRFLAEMKVWLLEQPEVEASMMSGSGSTMMAFLKIEDAAPLIERAKQALDPTLWSSFVEVINA